MLTRSSNFKNYVCVRKHLLCFMEREKRRKLYWTTWGWVKWCYLMILFFLFLKHLTNVLYKFLNFHFLHAAQNCYVKWLYLCMFVCMNVYKWTSLSTIETEEEKSLKQMPWPHFRDGLHRETQPVESAHLTQTLKHQASSLSAHISREFKDNTKLLETSHSNEYSSTLPVLLWQWINFVFM